MQILLLAQPSWEIRAIQRYIGPKAEVQVLRASDLIFHIHQGRVRIAGHGRELRPHLAFNWLVSPKGLAKDAIATLEATGVRVVNTPRAREMARLKPLTTLALARAGLPEPTSLFSRGISPSTESSLERLGYPLITKPWAGSMGLGVNRWETYHPPRTPFLFQTFVPNPGRDIRVTVVGDQPLGALYRIANPGNWKTNINGGYGEPKAGQLTKALGDLAVRAIQAVGLEVGGVDIIEGPDGYQILEVNGKPGIRIYSELTGVDIPKHIAQYLLSKGVED